MVDVSKKLIGQFVECLEEKLLDDSGAVVDDVSAAGAAMDDGASASTDSAEAGSVTGAEGVSAAPASGVIESEVEALDLMDVAGGAMLRRIAPVAIAVVVAVVLFLILR